MKPLREALILVGCLTLLIGLSSLLIRAGAYRLPTTKELTNGEEVLRMICLPSLKWWGVSCFCWLFNRRCLNIEQAKRLDKMA